MCRSEPTPKKPIVWLTLGLNRRPRGHMATGVTTFKNRILLPPSDSSCSPQFLNCLELIWLIDILTVPFDGWKRHQIWIIMEQTHSYPDEYLGQDLLTWLAMAGIWYFELYLIYWKCWIPVFLKTGLYGHDLFWLLVVKLNAPCLNAVISRDNTKLLSKNTSVCVGLQIFV